MKHKRNWIIGIILSATAAFLALQNVGAPTQNDATPAKVSFTETFTPAYEGCYYVWAYRDDPELTDRMSTTVKSINPAASASVTLFGEDCVYADGHSTFSVMETDFHVRLPVDDLTNEESFGNWIAQVMEIVSQLPREEIQGAKYGFVEFWFEKNEGEHIVFRVPIQQYVSEEQDKTGAELFRKFYSPP